VKLAPSVGAAGSRVFWNRVAKADPVHVQQETAGWSVDPPLGLGRAWIDRLQRLDPRRVVFAHDHAVWIPLTRPVTPTIPMCRTPIGLRDNLPVTLFRPPGS
jgi:hypothetical protein